MDRRTEVLVELAGLALAVVRPHPVRIAIDGCSAAGKTTLADELAGVLRRRTRRTVIRAGIDSFLRAVELRTAYPADSPESYYLDSWDNDAIRDMLLRPLGPGGSRRYRTQPGDGTAAQNLPIRAADESPVQVAPEDAVLLADGVFLQRPELDPHWDLRIYVDIGFDEVLRRGVARDKQWMGPDAEHRYRTKYIPGERRYVEEVRPAERAQVVVRNVDPVAPRLVVRP